MAEDALAAGGVVRIDTELLTNFAAMNLEAFLDELRASRQVQGISHYAEGGGNGVSPNGSYSQMLPSNVAKGQLASGKRLQSDYQALAKLVSGKVDLLLTNARQMQKDLEMIAIVIGDAAADAEITAEQMQNDLSNLNFGGAPSATSSGPADQLIG